MHSVTEHDRHNGPQPAEDAGPRGHWVRGLELPTDAELTAIHAALVRILNYRPRQVVSANGARVSGKRRERWSVTTDGSRICDV
jgi:hypothetical protein